MDPRKQFIHYWSINLMTEASTFNRGKSVFCKWYRERWTATCKTMKTEYILLLYKQTEKSLKTEICHNIIEPQKIGYIFSNINTCNTFLDIPPKLKEKFH